MLLKEPILTVSTLEGCEPILTVVLKELIF